MARLNLGDLFVTLSAETKDFQKGLEQSFKGLQDMGKSISDTGKTMTKWVTGPIVGAGGALLALGVKTGQFADRILDLNAITGMSTNSIQEWQHVSTVAGVDIEAVTRATEGLVRRLPGIAKEGGPAFDALQKLGLSANDLQKMTPDAMIDTLITSLAAMEDPLQRNALGSQLFGGAWKDMAPILALGKDGIAAAREEAHRLGLVMGEDALNAANDFRIEFDKLKAQSSALFREFATNLMPILSNVFVPLVRDQIFPAMQGFAQLLGRLAGMFTKLDPKLQLMIVGALGILAAIGPLLVILGTLISAVGTVGAALAGLTLPMLAIPLAIAALVAALIWLLATNEEFRDGVIAVWSRVKEAAQQILRAIRKFWEDHGAAIVETAKAIFHNVAAIFMSLFHAVVDIVSSLSKIVVEIFTHLRQFWDAWGATILSLITRVFDQIRITVQTAINLVKDIISLALAIIRGDWNEAWERIKSIGVTVWNFIRDTVRNVFTAIRDILTGIFSSIGANLTNAWNSMRTDAINRINTMRTDVINRFEQIWNYIKGIPAKAVQWGKDIINGLWNGIKSMASTLKNNVTNFINNNIPGPLKSLLGIKSPSDLFKSFGESIGEGLQKGILSTKRLVEGATETLTGVAMPDMRPQMAMAGGMSEPGTLRREIVIELRGGPQEMDNTTFKSILRQVLREPELMRDLDNIGFENFSTRVRPRGGV